MDRVTKALIVCWVIFAITVALACQAAAQGGT